MTYVIVALATIVFAFCFRISGIVAVSVSAIEICRRAMAVMREPTTSDDEKERAVRRFSLQLFGLFASIAARGILLLAAPMALIAGFSFVGLATFDEVVALLVSWEVILATTATLFILLGLRRLWR